MIYALDGTSAAVFATVFSTLLIALAIRKPVPIHPNLPRWLKIQMRVYDGLYIAAVIGAVLSIMGCLGVVADDSTPHEVTDWITTITAWLISVAVFLWFSEHMIRWREPEKQ